MSVNVLHVTREELIERRERLLRHAGLTRTELAERAAAYSLTGAEYDVLTDLEDVEFLLAER